MQLFIMTMKIKNFERNEAHLLGHHDLPSGFLNSGHSHIYSLAVCPTWMSNRAVDSVSVLVSGIHTPLSFPSRMIAACHFCLLNPYPVCSAPE